MNPTILVSRTFETISHDSAECGDFEDRGFVYEDRAMTFREIVQELSEFNALSASHVTKDLAGGVWACQSDGDTDYRTGIVNFENLHFSGQPKQAKFWFKALKAAGLIER